MPWTGNQPICQVVYISVFCLHSFLRMSRVQLFFVKLNMSRCTKKRLNAMALKKYVKYFFKVVYLYSVQPPFCCGGRGVESPTKISKKGPGKSQFLERGCWRRWVTFFSQGGDGRCCSFYIKNKLKSEILNDKKNYKPKCLSAITKNLNWQILTKNSVTFKR